MQSSSKSSVQFDEPDAPSSGNLGLIGRSPAFLQVVERIQLVARNSLSVMLEGESGTGKEVVARAIHALSERRGAFVPMNCGAIPADLFERELFGHKRSAFTGATTSEIGLVQRAAGGTLFLDEVDSLRLDLQTKLLRFLQEKEYRQLGSTSLQTANVRVLAATNADLEAAMRERRSRGPILPVERASTCASSAAGAAGRRRSAR